MGLNNAERCGCGPNRIATLLRGGGIRVGLGRQSEVLHPAAVDCGRAARDAAPFFVSMLASRRGMLVCVWDNEARSQGWSRIADEECDRARLLVWTRRLPGSVRDSRCRVSCKHFSLPSCKHRLGSRARMKICDYPDTCYVEERRTLGPD